MDCRSATTTATATPRLCYCHCDWHCYFYCYFLSFFLGSYTDDPCRVPGTVKSSQGIYRGSEVIPTFSIAFVSPPRISFNCQAIRHRMRVLQLSNHSCDETNTSKVQELKSETMHPKTKT